MTTWHAADEILDRFALDPESLDPATASSAELHLLRCEQCRSRVAAAASAADPAALGASWAAVADRIDAPRPTVVERLLSRAGVPDATSRAVAATPSLRGAWLLAMAVVVAGLVLLTRQSHGPGPFLVLAPLLPMAGVAAAFWPAADPAGESARATPLSGFGLAVRRAVAVLVPAVAAVALGAMAAPGLRPVDAAWLLPALALSATTVALSTWIRPDTAAVGLGGVWLAVAVGFHARAHGRVAVAELALFSDRGRPVWLALLAVSAVVAGRRRHSFAYTRRPL